MDRRVTSFLRNTYSTCMSYLLVCREVNTSGSCINGGTTLWRECKGCTERRKMTYLPTGIHNSRNNAKIGAWGAKRAITGSSTKLNTYPTGCRNTRIDHGDIATELNPSAKRTCLALWSNHPHPKRCASRVRESGRTAISISIRMRGRIPSAPVFTRLPGISHSRHQDIVESRSILDLDLGAQFVELEVGLEALYN